MNKKLWWMLIAMLPLLNANAQKKWYIKFEAQIVDENRQPLSQVEARVRGHYAAGSDASGHISLLVPPGDTLLIEHIGKKDIKYKLPEVSVKGATIMMEEQGYYYIAETSIQKKGGRIERVLYPELPKPDREIMPQIVLYDCSFPGGGFGVFLKENVNYPLEAQESGIEGEVFCGLTIDKEGYVTESYIIRGVDELLDNAVLDVAHKLPRFIPAKQHGKKISRRVCFSIQFKLKNKKFKDIFVEE